MENEHPIKTLKTRVAWSSRWYSIRQDAIQLPDGSLGEYNVIEIDDSVWVVPVTDSGDIVLIHNYRYPIKSWSWELPAGHIEPGQTAEDAARMELLQEAGGTAAKIKRLLHVSTLNGIGNHYGYFFLATGVTLSTAQPESTEVIRVQTFSIAHAMHMARSGEINDAVSVMALLLAEPLIKG